MSLSYHLTIGALADDIEVQLRQQGLTLGSNTDSNQIQRWANEISNLRIHGLLTKLESERARRRLLREIKPLVRRLPSAEVRET